MSENDDVEEDSAVRLQHLARHLRNSLAFAAPEIWTLHILESLGAAFDLGRASAGKARGEDEIEQRRRGA